MAGATTLLYSRIYPKPGSKPRPRKSLQHFFIGGFWQWLLTCEGTLQQEAVIRISELQYDLPPELIAQRPLERRDEARLLVLQRATGRIEHRRFADLPEYLTPRDCLVLNVTRVLPARFTAVRRTGGRVPGLFVRENAPGRWNVLLTGVGKLREGEALDLVGGPWTLTLVKRLERGECEVSVEPVEAAATILQTVGAMPLPPYIRREGHDAELDRLDREHYQTIYALQDGSVAAPTAGLHFTPTLIEKIRASGTATAELVLHLGLGTFQPIEVDDLAHHKIHSEWYSLSERCAETIAQTRTHGGRVKAIGTTSVRVLETCADENGVHAGSGWTNLLIYPPYRFKTTDALVTNFHLPGSTLLALVFAFAGPELARRAYREAVQERYRFYSYGDAMLVI